MGEQDPPAGNDISARKGRTGQAGRPEYKPTNDQRAEVVRLVAEGKTKTEIAAVIGISRLTLRKHFAAELVVTKAPLQGALELGAAPTVPPPEAAPPTQPTPAGRPEFEPTYRQRDEVRLWKVDGWSDDRIAQALGISRNTLLKHFGDELERGVDQVRTRVLKNLLRESDAGSVPASVHLLKLPGMLAPIQQLPPPELDEAAAPAPGKKEQANREARTAHEGNTWGSILKH